MAVAATPDTVLSSSKEVPSCGVVRGGCHVLYGQRNKAVAADKGAPTIVADPDTFVCAGQQCLVSSELGRGRKPGCGGNPQVRRNGHEGCGCSFIAIERILPRHKEPGAIGADANFAQVRRLQACEGRPRCAAVVAAPNPIVYRCIGCTMARLKSHVNARLSPTSRWSR